MINKNKLILGTAQFGVNYGITNEFGILKFKKAKEIFSIAKKNNIHFLDTAIEYKKSIDFLSKFNLKNFKIISKTPKLKNKPKKLSIEKWIISQYHFFLKKLNLEKIYAFLVHDPNDLRGSRGEALYNSLYRLKKQKKVKFIGVSIENTSEIIKIFSKFKFDIIQCKLNVFDQRLKEKKILKFLKKKKIKILIRSIFLQGLLLNSFKINKKFNKWKKFFDSWKNWLKKNQISNLRACTNFVKNQKFVNGVIVGVQSENELQDIINSFKKKVLRLNYNNLLCNDLKLINPVNW